MFMLHQSFTAAAWKRACCLLDAFHGNGMAMNEAFAETLSVVVIRDIEHQPSLEKNPWHIANVKRL